MADAYATFDQWVLHWGEDRSASLNAGSALDRQELVETALAAGAMDIDDAAFKGGKVVPLVPASLSTNPDTVARITAWLREKNIIIATYLHLQVVDSSEQVQRAQKWCEMKLQELRSGGGLGLAAPASDGLFDWISQPGASTLLTPQTFQRASHIRV